MEPTVGSHGAVRKAAGRHKSYSIQE